MTKKTDTEDWQKIISARKVLRVAFYIRVSTSEQVSKDNSLPAQKIALQEWCEKNNAVCAGLYADEGKSASKNIRKRKEIHRMMRDIRDGKIDLVIFTRFDRFTRNPEDYFKIMETMNAAGVQWKAIMQPELDLNTNMGQTLILFYLGINRQESANISERNKATVNVRIQKGAPITGAHNYPLSHTIGTDEHGNKKVIKDPEMEPIVWAYIDHYETHHSRRAAMEHCNNLFGTDIGYNRFITMITSPLMYGHYRDVDGYCEAYVTKERFESWAKINEKNVRVGKRRNTYVFSQLCICGTCGRKMTGAYSINSGGNRYLYYRCNNNKINKQCTNKHLTSEIMIEEFLFARLKPEIERYIAECEMIAAQPIVQRPKVDVVKKLEKELERLNYQYRKERISTEEYDAEYEALVKKISDARARQEKIEAPEVKDLEPLRKLLDMDLESLYQTFDRNEKMVFWRGIIKSITVLPDKQYKINFL